MLTNFFRSLTRRSAPPLARQRPLRGCRLQLLSLEDRVTPSTFSIIAPEHVSESSMFAGMHGYQVGVVRPGVTPGQTHSIVEEIA